MEDHSQVNFAENIRQRIYNVLPAASFQMHKLLNLLDIKFNDQVETACVEVGSQPVLHLNPEFLNAYCQADEHLFLLILHELYHITLGHTRLFPRSTRVLNIVFDAVINAMLCCQFPEEQYTQFFCTLNDWDSFPARLLRPPPGWPQRMDLESIPDAERHLFELLYGEQRTNVTYLDVFEVLRKSIKGSTQGVVLLGDHSGPETQGLADEKASRDDTLEQVLRKIVESWPAPPFKIAGRDQGTSPWREVLPIASRSDSTFSRALRRLLARAGIMNRIFSRRRSRARISRECMIETVLPSARDRRVPALETLTGHPPVYYRDETLLTRIGRAPQPVPHVYVDISGSMSDYLPHLVAALEPLHRRGLCQCFVFSTVVDKVLPRQLARQKLTTTGGTDIRCVMEHLFSLRKSSQPSRILILTDGYVGPVGKEHAEKLKKNGIRIYVGLVENGSREYLEPHAHHIEMLPKIGGKP